MIKNDVFSLLAAADGPVSGQSMSAQLHSSRMAVWKAIDALRQEGWQIDAAPRRGYTLHLPPQRIEQARVSSLVTCPWNKLITVLDCVDSTNTLCKKLAAEGAPEGTAVIARRQTAGRGRLGRRFDSQEGGLYLSLILRPDCLPEQLLHLTAMAAVAARCAIFDASGLAPDIKWTNDLVVGGKKLSGILTELSLDADTRQVDAVILGIGINCCKQSFDEDIARIAVSLEELLGKKPDCNLLCAKLLDTFYQMRQELLTEKKRWLSAFEAHCITLGQEVQLLRGDTATPARAVGLDENAGLVVQLSDGSLQTVSCGEVSVRGMYGYVDRKKENSNE